MAEETKQNQPNLFTDPNFVGMSKAGKFTVANLLVYTNNIHGCPGLFWGYSDDNKSAVENFMQITSQRASDALPGERVTPEGLFVELEVFGWLQIDAARELFRIPKAPLFMPPANRGEAVGWAMAFMSFPSCSLKERHLDTLRQACSHDAELLLAFDSYLIDGAPGRSQTYGQ